MISTHDCYADTSIQGYEDVLEPDYAVMAVSDTGTGIPAMMSSGSLSSSAPERPRGEAAVGSDLRLYGEL